MFLKEEIQTGTYGHDPTEDSLAALKLAQLKLKHGKLSYTGGKNIHQGNLHTSILFSLI